MSGELSPPDIVRGHSLGKPLHFFLIFFPFLTNATSNFIFQTHVGKGLQGYVFQRLGLYAMDYFFDRLKSRENSSDTLDAGTAIPNLMYRWYRWNVEIAKKPQQLQKQLKATAGTYIPSAADDADDAADAAADADANADDADADDDTAQVLTLPIGFDDVEATMANTETTEFGVACDALSDNKKGPLSFFLYIAYADTPTDFVKMGSCQDGVERTASLPNLTDKSARQKYTNLMSRYREVQRQVPVGPQGFMHFEIYQPSNSVHAWLDVTDSIKNFALSITGVEAALRCFLVTRHDGSSLLEQWAPTSSSSAAKSSTTSDAKLTELDEDEPQEQEHPDAKWSELEQQEQAQKQDDLLGAIHVPKSLSDYNLTEDMRKLKNLFASDQNAIERRFRKSISKQELLPRIGNMSDVDSVDVKDLVDSYRLKCKVFNALAVDHPLFQAYYKL